VIVAEEDFSGKLNDRARFVDWLQAVRRARVERQGGDPLSWS
jgi:hypothetical protein